MPTKPKVPKKKFIPKRKRSDFVPTPENANLVKSIRDRLAQIREYKKILIEDGLTPDEDDKKLESELIVQLIRIEKGLSPKKAPKKKKSKSDKLRA